MDADYPANGVKIARRNTIRGLPTAFLGILVFWLAWLFATFGLQAPVNPTVIFVITVCAISVAAAVFLVVDMAHS